MSIRNAQDLPGYETAAFAMVQMASKKPGFVSIESTRDPVTGRGITVSIWKDEASALAWKNDTIHSKIQAKGREIWYDWYRVIVAHVVRDYQFERSSNR